MLKQVSGYTVNFCPNPPESPFLEFQTRKPPPPHFGKLQIWDDQSLLWNTPHFGKLQIWDDQSLLWNTPHFGKLQIWMTKVYSGIPPPPNLGKLQISDDQSLLQNTPPFPKTSDLGWPKFTLEYPSPISENFRFGMATKVYSGIPTPHFLQIWDDQTLLRNTPPFWKTSELGWPKFTLKYSPPLVVLQSGRTYVETNL